MSGARGRRRGGRNGGRGGGPGVGRGNVNMTQEELNNLIQEQVTIALAAYQAAQQGLGGKSRPTTL